jgi:hypothetical protein
MKFNVGTVLSITTERMLSPDGIDGVRQICNFMTGEKLCTHHLVRAGKTCKPILLAQYPVFSGEAINHALEKLNEYLAKDSFLDWLKTEIYPITGEWIEIHPLDVPYFLMTPEEEMEFMRGSTDGIIRVDLGSKNNEQD